LRTRSVHATGAPDTSGSGWSKESVRRASAGGSVVPGSHSPGDGAVVLVVAVVAVVLADAEGWLSPSSPHAVTASASAAASRTALMRVGR
jgi:hypothetical protein